MQNSGVTHAPQTREELTQYEQGWCNMMVDIWHEQMTQLKTIDTGRLYSSVRGSVTVGDNEEIEHAFVQYGIYVNEGTGREFNDKVGNRNFNGDGTGQLQVLDYDYREERGLNKPRKRGPKWGGGYTSGLPRTQKPWFDRKYVYSIYRLRETLQASYGEQFQQLTIQALNGIFGDAAKVHYGKTLNAD